MANKSAPVDVEFASRLAVLHESVLCHDPIARESVASLLLRIGRRYLRVENPFVEAHIVNDAVVDSIISYLGAPSRYDCRLSRLDTFIIVHARYRLRNAVRSECRRLRREARLDTKAPETACDELWADAQAKLRDLIARTSEGPERAFLEARARGEQRAVVLARALGLEGLSAQEARKAVKRANDRLLARMRRLVRSCAGK